MGKLSTLLNVLRFSPYFSLDIQEINCLKSTNTQAPSKNAFLEFKAKPSANKIVSPDPFGSLKHLWESNLASFTHKDAHLLNMVYDFKWFTDPPASPAQTPVQELLTQECWQNQDSFEPCFYGLCKIIAEKWCQLCTLIFHFIFSFSFYKCSGINLYSGLISRKSLSRLMCSE